MKLRPPMAALALVALAMLVLPGARTPEGVRPQSQAQASAGDTYTVETGDSLYLIGDETGVSWREIARLNDLTHPYPIEVGQVLRLREDAACPSGEVRLTFDDGPTVDVTPQILDILEEAGVRTTFFWIGTEMEANPDLVRRAIEEGHSVQNHTWSHPDLTELDESEMVEEISRTSDLIEDLTGERPTEFRPPYRGTNDTIRAASAELGMDEVLWTVDPEDWKLPTAVELRDRIVPEAVNGSIILMHDAYSSSPDGLPLVIDGLVDRGFCIR